MLDTLRRDLRYALRMLAKSPGFTATAILTLAIGIGANTAIFTVSSALLLKPLPYDHPEGLMVLSSARPDQHSGALPFSFPRFEFLRDHSRSFSGIAAFTNENFNLTGLGDPEELAAARVSSKFFDVLGVRPALGRTFLPEEDRPGGKPVVLISDRFWRRRLGGASAALGRNLALDSRDCTIIGVLPSNFRFALLDSNADIWAPKVFELNIATPDQIRGGAGFLNAVARLAPGISDSEARAEMDVLNRQYQRERPGTPDTDPRAIIDANGLREQFVANVRSALLLLTGAVAFVLLIACANVASLLLSRALARRKEAAVRTALGAGRGDLIRQMLTESVALAFAGGVCGILLSQWGATTLAAMAASSLPRAEEIGLDSRVLAFTLALSIASGVLFGLAPALQLSRSDLNTVLRDESRGSSAGRGLRIRGVLVVAQVALSMVLLIGAGLLIRAFLHLQNQNPGFDARNVLTMSISLPPVKYSAPDQMIQFFDQAVKQTASLPGVQSATVSSALPVNPSRFSPVLFEGQPAVPLAQRPVVNIQTIAPGYRETMRVPLLRGRTFGDRDGRAAPMVAIINETAARRFWPNQDAIGKHILLGRLTKQAEVVGVFGDIKNITLAADVAPEIYLPYAQRPWASMNLSIRTEGDPRAFMGAARRRILNIDKDQPVTNVRTLEEVLAASRAQPRVIMLLLGVFSACALILAVVGIYGAISYSVAQRTRELGVRMALGASRRDILVMVVGHGVKLTVTGVAIGLIASLALTRVMTSQLYQVSATDPATFVVSSLLFVAVALAAAYVPARRAIRIDPGGALRYE
jgi:putative ABC transport system permease protein